MNSDELKKKIVEVVLNSEITGIQIRAITGGYSMANNIADALIAAGLHFGENLTATFDRMALEREHELERRLSDAEYWKCVYGLALNIAFTGEERAYYCKKAEEELKEGSRKDEQTCKIFAVGGKSDT